MSEKIKGLEALKLGVITVLKAIGFVLLIPWMILVGIAVMLTGYSEAPEGDGNSWRRYKIAIGVDPTFDEHGRLRNRSDSPEEGEFRIDVSQMDPWQKYKISIGAHPIYDEYGRLRNRSKKK